MDGDDPIGLVQQPLEHSMVTVDLVTDLLILDDYDATLNDTILIGISELGVALIKGKTLPAELNTQIDQGSKKKKRPCPTERTQSFLYYSLITSFF